MKTLIYSKEDLDLIMCLETEEMQEQINNLQSKIDKANEILDKWGEEPDADMYMQIKEYKEWKELKDILKDNSHE